MHAFRRSALRAVRSQPTSLLSKSSTSTPFTLRQAAFSTGLRRFEEKKDSESTIASAISSATETVSEYASKAAESLTHNATAARDEVSSQVSRAADAAKSFVPRGDRAPRGDSYAPRGDRAPRRDNYAPRGDRYSQGDRAPRERRERADRPQPMPSNTLYVGNLNFQLTAEDLERTFAELGVNHASIAMDDLGRSKGFGWVTFTTTEEAKAALEAKNGLELMDRPLVLNYKVQNGRLEATRTEMKEPTNSLFVGNMPYEMTDSDLNNLFREIKNVVDVRVAIDRRTGQPRGFAHADFVDVKSAQEAAEFLQGKEMYRRKLRVDFAASRQRGEGAGEN